MTTPRRRWSFSLRTLFVVVTLAAVPLGWLAYNLNWATQRRNAIKEYHIGFEIYPDADPGSNPHYAPPWPLAWFGEEPTYLMDCGNLTGEQYERVRALFPECPMIMPHEPYQIPEGPADGPSA